MTENSDFWSFSRTMADDDYEPKVKIKYHGRCWFCRLKFKYSNEVTKLDPSHCSSFVEDVCSANDEAAERTKAKQSEIISGKQEILFHKSCRNPYYSTNSKDSTNDQVLRRQSNAFEWRRLCMICGLPCDRRYKRDPKRGWSL